MLCRSRIPVIIKADALVLLEKVCDIRHIVDPVPHILKCHCTAQCLFYIDRKIKRQLGIQPAQIQVDTNTFHLAINHIEPDIVLPGNHCECTSGHIALGPGYGHILQPVKSNVIKIQIVGVVICDSTECQRLIPQMGIVAEVGEKIRDSTS